jgi:signal peptidase I
MKDNLLKLYNFSGTWPGTIIIVLMIIFFIAQAFVIPSGSMIGTLKIGDMLFVKKFAYGVPTPRIPFVEVKVLPDFNDNGHLIEGDKPKRGDIVVFRYPKNEKIHYIKRCVATGGDIVAMKNKDLLLHLKEGNEYIKKSYPKDQIIKIGDRLWVKNPYKMSHKGIHQDPAVTRDSVPYSVLFDMAPVVVPEGEYYMMGDNRDHSNDSRFWGTVPYKNIVGKPWFIYFSWDEEKNIRWDRSFRTVESLETEIDEYDNETKVEGIY